jgi:hypothetical protein
MLGERPGEIRLSRRPCSLNLETLNPNLEINQQRDERHHERATDHRPQKATATMMMMADTTPLIAQVLLDAQGLLNQALEGPQHEQDQQLEQEKTQKQPQQSSSSHPNAAPEHESSPWTATTVTPTALLQCAAEEWACLLLNRFHPHPPPPPSTRLHTNIHGAESTSDDDTTDTDMLSFANNQATTVHLLYQDFTALYNDA